MCYVSLMGGASVGANVQIASEKVTSLKKMDIKIGAIREYPLE